MADLSSYQIAYDDFKGSIDLFFTYVKNKRDILKTLSLSTIIEDFIVFTDEIEIQIKELIRFYYFANSLFYLKSQMIFPLELSPKKRDEKIVEKIINLGDKYNEIKNINGDSNSLESEISLVKDFIFSEHDNDEIRVLHPSQDDKVNLSSKKPKKENFLKTSKENEGEKDLPANNFDNSETKIMHSKYKTRILEKKMKIVNILRKEESFLFEKLLDPSKETYFFERFCYFLISLEYKISDIVDLFYDNKNFVLRKGRNINRYGQRT